MRTFQILAIRVQKVVLAFVIFGSFASAKASSWDTYFSNLDKLDQVVYPVYKAIYGVLTSPSATDAQKAQAFNQYDQELAVEQTFKTQIIHEYISETVQFQNSIFLNPELNDYGKSYRADASNGSTVLPNASISLAFALVGTNTGLPSALNAEIGSVLYGAYMDPGNFSNLTILGVSTDASNGFALPYTMAAGPVLIQATPYDLSGNPIFIPGVNYENVAVGLDLIFPAAAVPEPSSFALSVSGALGCFGYLLLQLRRIATQPSSSVRPRR